MAGLMDVRRMAAADVDAVVQITRASPEAAQWSEEDYQRAAAGKYVAWVAEGEDGVAAFLVARAVAGEMEILNFAVAPESRRRGLASRLLQSVLAEARELGVAVVHLEVRAANQAAVALYEKHGFTVRGGRPRYYTAPADDALLLDLALSTGR